MKIEALKIYPEKQESTTNFIPKAIFVVNYDQAKSHETVGGKSNTCKLNSCHKTRDAEVITKLKPPNPQKVGSIQTGPSKAKGRT